MFKITDSTDNKDLLPGETRREARDRYLRMTEGFESRLPDPAVHAYTGDRYILRTDLAPSGLKAYGAEQLISEITHDTLVYVAPRVGHAADAISTLAEMYDKRCVFFCPASKKVSPHQAALLAYKNVELRFIKIAAMPVLNKYAREWAERNGAKFLPFGLSGAPLVTAGIVSMTQRVPVEPTYVFAATSTGTMTRALQIGWPDAKHVNVAVARNMHDGEIGESDTFSSTEQFLRDAKYLPPFATTANYDAKAWDVFDNSDIPGSMFINVGSDEHIMRNADFVDVDSIDSSREWGDFTDLADEV